MLIPGSPNSLNIEHRHQARAHSTPTGVNSYVTVSNAAGAPQRDNGRLAASTGPGLGIAPRLDVFGEPVVEIT